jgi:hypothetical protein
MFERATAAGSYEKALAILSEYVQTELSGPEGFKSPVYDTRGYERLYKTICGMIPCEGPIGKDAVRMYLAAPDVYC